MLRYRTNKMKSILFFQKKNNARKKEQTVTPCSSLPRPLPFQPIFSKSLKPTLDEVNWVSKDACSKLSLSRFSVGLWCIGRRKSSKVSKSRTTSSSPCTYKHSRGKIRKKKKRKHENKHSRHKAGRKKERKKIGEEKETCNKVYLRGAGRWGMRFYYLFALRYKELFIPMRGGFLAGIDHTRVHLEKEAIGRKQTQKQRDNMKRDADGDAKSMTK